MAVPVIYYVRPPSGRAEHANHVAIMGEFEEPIEAVTVRSVSATDILFLSASELRCTTPALSAGMADVGVIGGGKEGGSTVLANAYEFKKRVGHRILRRWSGRLAGG